MEGWDAPNTWVVSGNKAQVSSKVSSHRTLVTPYCDMQCIKECMNLVIPRTYILSPTTHSFPSVISQINTWQSINSIITCRSIPCTLSDKRRCPPLLPLALAAPPANLPLRANCQAWLQLPSPSTSLPVPLIPLQLLRRAHLLAPTRTTCLPALKRVPAQVSTLART